MKVLAKGFFTITSVSKEHVFLRTADRNTSVIDVANFSHENESHLVCSLTPKTKWEVLLIQDSLDDDEYIALLPVTIEKLADHYTDLGKVTVEIAYSHKTTGPFTGAFDLLCTEGDFSGLRVNQTAIIAIKKVQ